MEEFQDIPILQIVESRTNPRRHFDQENMDELISSIKEHGILTPLFLRPINRFCIEPGRVNGQSGFWFVHDRDELAKGEQAYKDVLPMDPFKTRAEAEANCPTYEIVAGARRFRAAKAVGLTEITGRVREMTDEQALELQVVENLQRADVHPLDEALGYRALMDKAGHDVAAIAAKVGKSESYVYQRLKLSELIEEAQQAFFAERITAGHAILIARLQPADQEKALEACFEDDYGYAKLECARPTRELSQWIDEEIHLDLHRAGFKKDDADLVPGIGPCTTCPKRTGFVPALFPDISKKDTCTDRHCYHEKLEAHIARNKARLEEKGVQFLQVSTDYQSGKAKDGEPLPRNRYVEIANKKDRCESAQKAIVVEGREGHGKTLEVCADPHCKKHRPYNGGDGDRWRQEQKRAEQKRRREYTVRRKILSACTATVTWPLERKFLELLAIGVFEGLWTDHQKEIAAHHEWEAEKKKGGYGIDYDGMIRKRIPGFSPPELASFLMELSVIRQIDGPGYGNAKDRLLELAALCGVDSKAIEKNLIAEEKAKEAKKKVPSKKKAPAAQSSKTKGKSAKSDHERRAKWMKRKTKKPGTSPLDADQSPDDQDACEKCGCTENSPCPGGCAWSERFSKQGRLVCTSCEEAVACSDKAGAKSACRFCGCGSDTRPLIALKGGGVICTDCRNKGKDREARRKKK